MLYVTLHSSRDEKTVAKGNSGRLVVEVEPALKRQLYAALALSGSTLKDWFVTSAERYCDATTQSDLFDVNAKAQVNDDDGAGNQAQARTNGGR